MKKSMRHSLTLLLFVGVTSASAVPVISVDLDPGVAGIQSTVSIGAGSSFKIKVTFTGDGATLFDAFSFDTVFNDAGAVLGLAGSAGSPTAGGVAALAPFLAVDPGSGAFVVPGSVLTPIAMGFPIPAPFTGQSGGIGIAALGPPFLLGGLPIGPGVTIDLFELTFDALMPGMSSLAPSAGVVPVSFGGLSLIGANLPFTSAGGIVTVTGVISEPASFLLFVTGLGGLTRFSRKKLESTRA